MSRIGIVAAFPGELKPLVRGWHQEGSVWMGRLGEHEAVATCAGMGAAAAARACEALLGTGALDALISVGWAGSLSCGLKPPSACAVREVVDAATGEAFAANQEGQRLITLDRVAGPEEKRRLAQAHQAALVDMEAAAVARFARGRGIRFLCFKAVTDGPNDQLPDFHRFTGEDGQLRTAALAAWAAWHPQYWRALRQLERNSGRAAEELTILLSRWLGRWQ